MLEKKVTKKEFEETIDALRGAIDALRGRSALVNVRLIELEKAQKIKKTKVTTKRKKKKRSKKT